MRTPSRSTLTLAAVALAGSLLAACGAGQADPIDVGAAPGQTAPDGGDTDHTDGDDPADDTAGGTGADTGDDTGTGQDGTTDDSATDGSTDDRDAPSDGDTPATSDFQVRPEGQELVMEIDGHVTVLYTLPDEGESVFRSAAVRPGGTSRDFVVVTVTSAEGMYDLRWLEVSDGEAGELKLFGDTYDLGEGTDAAFGERAPNLVWSHDGASLAWLEPVEDGAMLRTIGWSYGPGTGQTADDNASFGLEGVPADATAVRWEAAAGTESVIVAESAGGQRFDIVLERQGDGALALKDVRG